MTYFIRSEKPDRIKDAVSEFGKSPSLINY